MDITPEDIRKFRATWKKELEEEITEEEARNHILRLDELYRMLARPSRNREVSENE